MLLVYTRVVMALSLSLLLLYFKDFFLYITVILSKILSRASGMHHCDYLVIFGNHTEYIGL